MQIPAAVPFARRDSRGAAKWGGRGGGGWLPRESEKGEDGGTEMSVEREGGERRLLGGGLG